MVQDIEEITLRQWTQQIGAETQAMISITLVLVVLDLLDMGRRIADSLEENDECEYDESN